MNEPIKPDYMGDAVYATHCDTNSIMLTTDHHEEAQAGNVIFLEPSVMLAVINYAIRAGIYTPPTNQPTHE